MTKIEILSQTMGRLRKEKQPPLTRYAVCLAIAQCGTGGAGIRDIHRILVDIGMEGTVDNLTTAASPLICVRPNPPGEQGHKRYLLLPAGVKLVAGLLNPKPALAKNATRA